MPDVTTAAEKESQEVAEKKSAQPAESKAPVTVVQGGRRRGRRKVMKKKKVKDEDGYLGECHILYALLILANSRSYH